MTGCDTLKASATDTVYEADEVDQPVRAIRLPVEDMPIRIGHHLTGHSDLRFTVERSGKIDRCSLVLLDETAPNGPRLW